MVIPQLRKLEKGNFCNNGSPCSVRFKLPLVSLQFPHHRKGQSLNLGGAVACVSLKRDEIQAEAGRVLESPLSDALRRLLGAPGRSP